LFDTQHRKRKLALSRSEEQQKQQQKQQTSTKQKYGKSEITSLTQYNHQTVVMIVTIHGLTMKARHPGSFSGKPLREFLSTRCLNLFTFYIAFKYHVSKTINYGLYYE